MNIEENSATSTCMLTVSRSRDARLAARLNEPVQSLHAGFFPTVFKPYDADYVAKAFEAMLSDDRAVCYVAFLHEVPVGYILCMIREQPENAFQYAQRTLLIDQISVLQAYRRSGAGSLLLKEAERYARENRIDRIELDHWTANVEAARFFRSKGFELFREKLYREV